jgi:hypothetical protein
MFSTRQNPILALFLDIFHDGHGHGGFVVENPGISFLP